MAQNLNSLLTCLAAAVEDENKVCRLQTHEECVAGLKIAKLILQFLSFCSIINSWQMCVRFFFCGGLAAILIGRVSMLKWHVG